GSENFVSILSFKKTGSMASGKLAVVCDYLVWYARDQERMKFRELFADRRELEGGLDPFRYVLLQNGEVTTRAQLDDPRELPDGSKLCQSVSLTSQDYSETRTVPFKFRGKTYNPPANRHWSISAEAMERLAESGRIFQVGDNLRFASLLEDNPITPINNVWTDTGTGSFTESQLYVVQTATKALARCLLMTTEPGDLVLDPTCGSGTTAYVAEQWGRRWITIDVSRVPLALARQRLLTATFPWYELADEPRGPAGGFVYKRKQNRRGEEVGGIVPHVTLKSIANNEPPKEEVLVDRPEPEKKVTRVAGPFCVEATIPTPVDLDGDGQSAALTSHAAEHADFEERMIEILRRSPLLRLSGNRTVQLHNLRKPAKTLSLSAEAVVDAEPQGARARRGSPDPAETADRRSPAASGDLRSEQVARSETGHSAENMLPLSRQPVGFVFGPENGAVSEKLVFEAAREASAKSYTHLYVIGFAIQPKAREFIEHADSIVGIPATYVQATPDLMMGDLLKNMRSSQIFSVCGLPDVKIHGNGGKKHPKLQVELLGMDVFDPTTLDVDNRPGNDVPAWLLDTDYNDLCFHVCQAFFPRTRAWDSIRKALKGTHDDTVWDHLAGTISAPFEPGEHNKIAVKVIDDRGNELMVVKDLNEGKSK
ncbi:MAG: site-specific DNA-methyltransferase, partial [Planctomycetia bacterium]|nr:site-specific DNA-methyltransferase [Planctomycetia bacterium]